MTPTTSVANPLQVETAPKPALPADIEQSRANFDLATHLKKLAEEKRQAEVDAINMRRLDLSKLSMDELEALQLACGNEIAARTASRHTVEYADGSSATSNGPDPLPMNSPEGSPAVKVNGESVAASDSEPVAENKAGDAA